jgi:hypothetical protein
MGASQWNQKVILKYGNFPFIVEMEITKDITTFEELKNEFIRLIKV